MASSFASVEPFFQQAGIDFLVGAGAPTGITAAKGSLYVNTTGSSASTRMYVNTDGGTTWTSFTTAA